jgi:hypothetical protein
MKSSNSRICLSLLCLLLLNVFSGCTDWVTNFEPVGEKDPVTITKSTHSVLIIKVQLGIGSINLEAVPTASYLVDVVTTVSIREGSGGTLENAEEVTSTEVDLDTMKITFDSNDVGIQVDYKYDLWIKVGSNITLQLDFNAATAVIDVDLEDSDITLSSLSLIATTGSISLTLTDLLFIDSTPTVESTTGDQTFIFTNIRYMLSTSWDIATTTGMITFDLTDNLPLSNLTKVHTFDTTATTGNIIVGSDFHQDIGLSISASASTGTITLPGGLDHYTSSNYDSSLVKYDFELNTSTGSITFSSNG